MSVNEVRLKEAPQAFAMRGTGPETSRTFVIGNEDHTLGNALRHVLIRNTQDVSFAGYSVPHPSEPVVHIRVQTTGEKTAGQALQGACDTLSAQCDIALKQLESLIPAVKEDHERVQKILEERERADQLAEEEDDDDEDMEDAEE